MINKDDLENVISVINTHLGNFASEELTGYSYGSYFIPPKYSIGTSYLSMYEFTLEHVYSLLDEGLDYNDFGFTDELIIEVIDKSNELIFNYE